MINLPPGFRIVHEEDVEELAYLRVEIERLRGELERLREALEKLTAQATFWAKMGVNFDKSAIEAALAALEGRD